MGSPCVRMDATRRSAPDRTQPPCVHVIAERWGALRGSLMAARECWTSGSTVTCEPRAGGPPPPRRRCRQRVPLASERTPCAGTPLYDRRATKRCYMRIPTLWMAAVTEKRALQLHNRGSTQTPAPFFLIRQFNQMLCSPLNQFNEDMARCVQPRSELLRLT